MLVLAIRYDSSMYFEARAADGAVRLRRLGGLAKFLLRGEVIE